MCPLLDRIDMHVELSEVSYSDISSNKPCETSFKVKERVEAARKIQRERYKDAGVYTNSQMSGRMVKKYCEADEKAKQLIEDAFKTLDISARSYTRILKVARTVADLEGSEMIKLNHVASAVQFRTLDRKYWG